MVERRHAVALIVVALAGCDELFGLDPISIPIDAPAADVLDAAPDAFVLVCPAVATATYTQDSVTGSYYLVVNAQRPFIQAAEICAAHRTLDSRSTGHTHLAVVSNLAELDQLFALSGDGGWLGLTNLKTPSPAWVTSEAAQIPQSYWSPYNGEPNNLTFEQCSNFMQEGKLHTNPCTQAHQYVCECDAYANEPSRYSP
jgi:hypothetical protein